jgi:hypothetical protein
MPWRRRRSSEDFEHEIEAHLAHEIDQLVSEGMDPAAARLVARRRFGGMNAFGIHAACRGWII